VAAEAAALDLARQLPPTPIEDEFFWEQQTVLEDQEVSVMAAATADLAADLLAPQEHPGTAEEHAQLAASGAQQQEGPQPEEPATQAAPVAEPAAEPPAEPEQAPPATPQVAPPAPHKAPAPAVVHPAEVLLTASPLGPQLLSAGGKPTLGMRVGAAIDGLVASMQSPAAVATALLLVASTTAAWVMRSQLRAALLPPEALPATEPEVGAGAVHAVALHASTALAIVCANACRAAVCPHGSAAIDVLLCT
jgi:hypothetical protein